MAEIVLGRLKFKWQGPWATATAYIKDDVVGYGGSSYVCITNHTSAGAFSTDAAKWELMLEGATPLTTNGDMMYRGLAENERLPIGAEGEALIVTDGLPAWQGLATAQSIYYVKADGNDANDGSNLNQAFKTIRHAVDTVTGPATIYVKGGLYYEQLPLTVKANVTVVGDGQRNTGVAPLNVSAVSANVAPAVGGSVSTTIEIANGDITGGGTFQVGCRITGTGITGTVTVAVIEANTPSVGFTTLTVSFSAQTVASEICTITSDYSEGTMWQLNDGATLNKMYFRDMAGFAPSLSFPEDVTQATIKGIFIALDPAHPIVNKSPYILECAAFSDDGAIGALIDGDVHASGNKSMVFHGYTIVCSDGIGYWVHGQGKAELVSCFTYYCWIGYTTTGGGKIRSLSGNNSYGTYGVISRGFDVAETPLTGALHGEQLVYNPLSLTGGEFSVGNTITGSASGATGVITNVQTAVNKIYYIAVSGTFLTSDTIDNAEGVTADIAVGGVTGQKGFVLVIDGLSAEPIPGGSLSIAGDSGSYIIQSVTGTYVNSSSVLTLVLANEKVTASANNAVATVRYQYSNSRLTGHDFLSIGTGDKVSTNYPGVPLQDSSQANEVIESFPGRVFYVSTDQDGNFRVGDYFRVDQATGRATLNASAFDLSGLTSLRLGSIGAQLGELVNEFSSDYTLSGNSNEAVPTEAAVRNYFPNVATNIAPVNDNILTLGTPTNRWNHVYVGPGSVTIGSLVITDDAGSLSVTGASSAPATINISEVDTGNIRYFQNNIIGTNSNEDIIISPSGTGSVVIDAINVNGTTIDSTDSSGITFTPAVTVNSDLTVENDFRVTHDAVIGNNLIVDGNLTVNGTETIINTTNYNVTDSLIYMGDDNPADTVDIGFISSFTNGGYQHTGFVRDATDGVWKLFKGVTDEPDTTVNFNQATYANLKIDGLSAHEGIFTSSVSAVGLTTTSALAVNTSSGITTNALSFALVNTTTNGINFGGAATTINVGATTGTLTLNNPTVVGSQSTVNLWNTTSTTVNAFGAATAINAGKDGNTVTTLQGKLTTVGVYGTTHLTTYASLFLLGTSTNNIVQVSSSNLAGGIGMWSPGSGGRIYSNAGIEFRTGATLRDQDTPTSSTVRLTITTNGGVSFGSSGTAYGSSGQLLQSNGDTSPTWVTPNYASTGKAIAMAMVFG